MKRANAVGFVQAITSAILILLLVYQQADCVGLLHHQKTARLTTFGNQNTATKNSTAQHKTTVSGKECKSDTDCAGIANTTCMRHPDDTKLRCLCGEKKSPQNGACHHSKQGLHHKCNVDEDCIRNAACKANSTTQVRTCECMENYDEDDHECSSSPLTRVPPTQAVFLLLFYPILQLTQ